MITPLHLPADHGTTVVSKRDADTVTITYRAGYGSRRAASVIARQYARDAFRRAAFIGQEGDTYVYLLISPYARLRAQLSDDIQNH